MNKQQLIKKALMELESEARIKGSRSYALYELFQSKEGLSLFEDMELLNTILDLKSSNIKYLQLLLLSEEIPSLPINKDFSTKYSIKLEPIYRYFSSFMNYGCYGIGEHQPRIPFQEWECLARKQMNILQALIREGETSIKNFLEDKRFKDFDKECVAWARKMNKEKGYFTNDRLKELNDLAKKGCFESQYNLGHIYLTGETVLQDYKKALYWFKKPAELQCEHSQHNIGIMYFKGLGVPQDYKKAFYWFKKSAKQENKLSQICIGHMYYQGLGTFQNYNQALFWYKKANKDEMAQWLIGQMYAEGSGVPQDYKKALYWFKKSAKGNHVCAQCKLAEIYAKGTKNIPQDHQKAYVWFDVAFKASGGTDNTIKKERDRTGLHLDHRTLEKAKKQSKEVFSSIVFSFRVGAE